MNTDTIFNQDGTRRVPVVDNRTIETHAVLSRVYEALEEKGYAPIDQIVGYLLSNDPTYITSHKNARTMMAKLDRDETMEVLVRSYLSR